MGEREAELRLLAYMVGFRKGATGAAFHEDRRKDGDFMDGFCAGRAATRDAYGRACERYGTRLNVLRFD